jgi:hypothetical protein
MKQSLPSEKRKSLSQKAPKPQKRRKRRQGVGIERVAHISRFVSSSTNPYREEA